MPAPDGERALAVEDLHAGYATNDIIAGISLCVGPGELVALIGPNGAGKTTILRALGGLGVLRSGSVRFFGEEVAGRSSNSLGRRGLLHVPEGSVVFPPLTVLDNLQLAANALGHKIAAEDLDRTFELFPVLKARASQRAVSLSGGEQKMLGIARALVARPRLLMLDEPTAGLSVGLQRMLVATLSELSRGGLSMLLVEQNLNVVRSLPGRAVLLDRGLFTWEGTTADVEAEDAVTSAVLGKGLEL